MLKNSSKAPLFTVGFTGLYFVLPIILHILFLAISKYNYPMADDSRIIGEFFLEYHSADSFIGKLQAIFKRENEGSPALIRYIYLVSYQLTGKIEFKLIGILGNFLAFVPMFILYDLFKTKKKNLLLILAIPYILLSTISFFTFYYSFVTLFYIGSAVIPIWIFYLHFEKNSSYGVYILLSVLLFSSAVIIPTAGILLLHAILTKKSTKAIIYGLFIGVYLLLVKVILKSTNLPVPNSSYEVLHLLNNFIIVSKLFFMTLGSWVLLFFKGNTLLSLLIGVLEMIAAILLAVKYFKKDNSVTTFFFVSIIFLSLLIFINIWFRWNENQEKYLNYILSFEKSFFFILLLTLLITFFIYFNSSRVVGLLLFVIAFTTYTYQYYYSYTGWLNWYKTSLLSSINRQWLGPNSTPFRNNTQLFMYNKLVESGFCAEEKNIFTENKALIETYIQRNPGKQHSDLQMAKQDSSVLRKDMVFFSFSESFPGDAYNRLDGTYILFTHPNDKYLIPTQFNPLNPLKAVLNQRFYSNWMSAQISNVLDDELKEDTYDIYIIKVKEGKFLSIMAIDKKLIKNSKQYNLVETGI